jgi:hypothetical protein
MDHYDTGCTRDACNRGDVADEIEAEIVVERRVPRVGRRDVKERVPIGARPDNHISSEIASRTRLIVDDDLLPKPLRQPLCCETRNNVGQAAGKVLNDQVHRSRRVIDRRCDARSE